MSDVRNDTLRECAKIARLAPGQDWGDGTTPAEMAEFIASVIEDKIDPARDTGEAK